MTDDEQEKLRELLEESTKQQRELLERFSEIREGLESVDKRQTELSRRMAMHMSRLMTLEAYQVISEIDLHGKAPSFIVDPRWADMLAERQSTLKSAIGDLAIKSYEDLLDVIDENEVHAAFVRDVLSLLQGELKPVGVN